MTPYLCMLAAAFLWGSSFIAGKFALVMLSAPTIVLLRFVIASVFWLPIFAREWRALSRPQWVSMLTLAFLMIPATFLLQFIGLSLTSASSAALMMGFEPLMVVVLGWLIWGERATRSNVVYCSMATFGVLLVMGYPDGAHFLGCLLVLISSSLVGISVRWSKRWMNVLPVNTFTALNTVSGTAMMLPTLLILGFVMPSSPSAATHWTGGGIAALLYLGVGCSLGASWLWNKGVNEVEANTGGLFLALEPVFGFVLATWLLHEVVSLRVMLGAALVILPMLLSALESSGLFRAFARRGV